MLSLSLPASAQPTAEPRSGISIVKEGVDAQGRDLYSVQADRAELADLLRQLFAQTGEEFTIAQDVGGTVDFRVKNAPLEQIVARIQTEVARPPLRIRRDAAGYHVTRALDAQKVAEAVAERTLPGGPGSRIRPVFGAPLAPIPLQGQVPSDRLVSLSVPETDPIPLSEALSRISSQARFPVTLDPRVSRQVVFTGEITQGSLPVVLQSIAETAGLKVVANGLQAILVPTDRFTIRVRDVLLGHYPTAAPCRHCGLLLSADWSYCPRCGLLTPQGQRLLKGTLPRTGR